MSRAFVKEPEGAQAVESLPDRPISPHPNFVTAQGLSAIDAELARLAAEWVSAQAASDHDAMARIARDRRYWTARRASAQVVASPPDTDMVRFGSTVTIRRADGRRQTFRIVGEDEADPSCGSVSHVSPFARALLRRTVGDLVEVAGQEVEIVAIG